MSLLDTYNAILSEMRAANDACDHAEMLYQQGEITSGEYSQLILDTHLPFQAMRVLETDFPEVGENRDGGK